MFESLKIKIKIGDIPIIWCGQNKNPKKIFFILNVANAPKEIVKMYDLKNIDTQNNLLVSLDWPGVGESPLQPSKKIRYYLYYINQIINYFKDKYPNSKFNLIGESFGADIAILYAKKYPKSIDTLIASNPPFGLRNPKKSEESDSTFYMFWTHLFTLLFNKEYKTTPAGFEQLTNNELLKRMFLISRKKTQSSRLHVAAWKAMMLGKKATIKRFKNDLEPNSYFFFAKNEFYCKKNQPILKKIKQCKTTKNKIFEFNSSEHFLFFDPQMAKQIWEKIL